MVELMKDEQISKIEQFWKIKNDISNNIQYRKELAPIIANVLQCLNNGSIQVVSKKYKNTAQKNMHHEWVVNEWIKKAILLNFIISDHKIYESGCMRWYDKVNPRFAHTDSENFAKQGCRIVPGAFIREGAYIGKNTVLMPSFVNIGAYVGDGTMIDSWATIGSCAYVGKNCHISGGAGIGGVLEPLQAKPVIIEDDCFIGARSEIVEGVIIEKGSVISMGVYIGASTKIVDRTTGEIFHGRIPAYSVVVSGTMPPSAPDKPSLYCAVIIKKVDAKTRQKTSINELLRNIE